MAAKGDRGSPKKRQTLDKMAATHSLWTYEHCCEGATEAGRTYFCAAICLQQVPIALSVVHVLKSDNAVPKL